MRVIKFIDDFSHDIGLRHRKSWPKGWPADREGGEVEDDVAYAAVKAKTAEFAGGDAEANQAWFEEKLAEEPAKARKATPIPLGWEDLNAAETITLARSLGAGLEITTKCDAAEYIGEVLEERATKKPKDEPKLV